MKIADYLEDINDRVNKDCGHSISLSEAQMFLTGVFACLNMQLKGATLEDVKKDAHENLAACKARIDEDLFNRQVLEGVLPNVTRGVEGN